ncbi:MAG TPA: type III pantothenate kinase, partial [Thermodesulfobacteriota bacterium]|nr:type III pantothenate kinase [Thermodesulfobacteriota bacterium]
MLLAIDIGNTNIVAGLFSDGSLVRHRRIATDTGRAARE